MKHKITLVTYMAFDRKCTGYFKDMELEDIKDCLFVICNTFDIIEYEVHKSELVEKQVLRVPTLS